MLDASRAEIKPASIGPSFATPGPLPEDPAAVPAPDFGADAILESLQQTETIIDARCKGAVV
jgi:hypothetical protein